MAAPVSFSRVTVSGVSSTYPCLAWSNVSLTCGARRGRSASLFIRIGVVDGIQHAPQNVALERQCCHGSRLLLRCPAVLGHYVQGVCGVARCLRHARPVVVEPEM